LAEIARPFGTVSGFQEAVAVFQETVSGFQETVSVFQETVSGFQEIEGSHSEFSRSSVSLFNQQKTPTSRSLFRRELQALCFVFPELLSRVSDKTLYLFLLVHDKKEKQTAPHGCYT
jgi:hypothetical protein